MPKNLNLISTPMQRVENNSMQINYSN